MGHLTYLPSLIRFLRQICVYIVRYDKTIRENLPPTAIEPYNALKESCDALLEQIDLPTGS